MASSKKISVEQYLRWSYKFIDKHLYHEVSKIAEETHLPKELIVRAMCSGKRFRPMLVFLSAQACGGRPENAVRLATAAELIHESTLLHDDLVDNDTTRRGQPTFNRMVGGRLAVALGDAGLAHSIDMVKGFGSDLITLTATTISTLGKTFIRETIDRTFESEGPILDLIVGKTAVLFATACTFGGRSANAPPQWEDVLYQYGKNLGVSFQIADDFASLLAALGGKSFSDGITLPLFYLFVQQPHLKDSIFRFAEGEVEFDDIRGKLNGNLEGLSLAKRKLFEYNNKAVYYANQLPESPFSSIMQELPGYVCRKMIQEGGSGVVRRWNDIRV